MPGAQPARGRAVLWYPIAAVCARRPSSCLLLCNPVRTEFRTTLPAVETRRPRLEEFVATPGRRQAPYTPTCWRGRTALTLMRSGPWPARLDAAQGERREAQTRIARDRLAGKPNPFAMSERQPTRGGVLTAFSGFVPKAHVSGPRNPCAPVVRNAQTLPAIRPQDRFGRMRLWI